MRQNIQLNSNYRNQVDNSKQNSESYQQHGEYAQLSQLEMEEMDIAKKLEICRNRLQIIGEGSDEDQCALIKNFFAERSNRQAQETQVRTPEDYMYDHGGSVQYELDPEILQLTESQQNDETSYRQQLYDEQKIKEEKENLEREYLQVKQESQQEITVLKKQLEQLKNNSLDLQKELESRLDEAYSRNKELEDEILQLQENIGHFQQVINDLTEQRESLYQQLTLQKIPSFSNHMGKSSTHQSFLLNDKSQVLCDITYDPESARNKSFDRSRQSRSFIRRNIISEEQGKKDRIVEDLLYILKMDNPDQIVPEIQYQIKTLKQLDNFISSLQDMIIKLTPPEIYKEKIPSIKDCWRWIKRILGDYMNLKKNIKNIDKIITQLIEILGVDNENQIIEEVQIIINKLFEAKKKYKFI